MDTLPDMFDAQNLAVSDTKYSEIDKIVRVESEEFKSFISEMFSNSNGISRAHGKRPVTYDICLT